jgi:hypothetical protein
MLADQHRYRDAIERWDAVIVAQPDGPFGQRARRDRRTARDLAHIFVRRQTTSQPGAAEEMVPQLALERTG